MQSIRPGRVGDRSEQSWGLRYLREVLLEAAAAGYRIGVANPPQSEHPTTGEDEPRNDREGRTGKLTTVVQDLRYRSEIVVADELDAERAYWMEMAIEAAVFRGAEAAGSGRDGGPSIEEIAEQLLQQVVEHLVAATLPGAEALLGRHDDGEAPPQLLFVRTPDGGLQARTKWLRGPGGSLRQWCLVRRGQELWIGRRMGGHRKVELVTLLSASDVQNLTAIVGGDGGGESRT